MKSFKDNIFIKYIYSEYSEKILKRQVLDYYKDSNNPEIKDITMYIRKNGISMFNYNFINKYKKFHSKVVKDKIKGLFYVIHNGKRLYFSRNLNSTQKVCEYYRGLCIEQDIASPHCYLNNNFNVNYGDIVVDIGAAEGNFSLDVIDKVKQLYIFECDDLWIEALRATFEPYKHKVKIIKKYVSNINNKKNVTLDRFFKNKEKKIDFIKMDIEGEEPNALKGAINLLKSNNNVKLAVCVYHNLEDENKVRNIFKSINTTKEKVQRRRQNKYIIETNGYVAFLYSKKKLKPPYLTRGVLRIQQSNF